MIKVPLKQKIAIASAQTGIYCFGYVIGGALLKLYTDFIGLSPILYGMAFLFYAIWNAINDPIFGYLSDKSNPKPGKGKRLPFIKISIPIVILGFFGLLISRPGWSETTIFIILLIALLIFDTGATIFYINMGALSIAITDDPQERAKISVITSYFTTIPGALVGLIPFYFLTGDFPFDVILWIYVAIGLAGSLAFIGGIYLVKEPIEIYKETQSLPMPLKDAIKETFRSKGFIIWVIYSFAMSGVSAAFSAVIIYYLGDVFRVSGFEAILPAGVAGILQLVVMYPLILKIRKRIGNWLTIMIFASLMCIGYIGLFFVTNYYWMIFFYWCILSGFSVGVVGSAIMGDICDEDELKTGKRREGMFCGIGALFTIPAQGLFIFFFTFIIQAYGYDGKAPIQSPQAVLGIRIGVALLPIIFLSIGLIAWIFYPLRGDRYREMKEKVRVLYEQKFNQNQEKNINEKTLSDLSNKTNE